jgi:hypothetical protein
MTDDKPHVDFQVTATLHKWPSLNNRRRDDRDPYLVAEGTLESCIRELMAKPEATRELYDIRTAPQPPLVLSIMNAQHVAELGRLREFFERSTRDERSQGKADMA